MKILLFTSKSLYNERMIRHTLAPQGYEILLTHQEIWSPETIQTYQEAGVSRSLMIPNLNEWEHVKTPIGKLFVLFRNTDKVVKEFDPDVVNLQYVNVLRAIAALFSAGKSRRLILSFWGSDLLRQEKWICLRMLYPMLLKRANAVTVDGLYMKEYLHQLYKGKWDHKVNVIRYCNPIIELIDHVQQHYTKKEMRARLHIPNDDKIILSIGYNSSPAHQHIEITNTISKLPREIQKRMFLVYPMTYGMGDNLYFAQINIEREKLFCGSVVLRDFLTDEECALLYCAVDGFIHAQISDAYSQTFVDYVYAGATVFQAAWLHYPEINKYGLKLYEFSDFQQLQCQLEEYIGDFPNHNIQQTKDAHNDLYETESLKNINEKMKKIIEGE